MFRSNPEKSLLTVFLQRIQPNENVRVLILAIMVGLTTALGVWLFRRAIEFADEVFIVGLGDNIIGEFLLSINVDPRWSIVFVLMTGGLIVGLMAKYFIGPEKYHGVAAVMESVALAGGRLPYAKAPIKAIASAISIGAGASVGPEDPSVQIGANLGSFFGQRLNFREDRMRLLVAAGAASAIAAAFNAPIAGVFFALEVILGEFQMSSFSLVVLASVIASAFSQLLGSTSPLFGELAFALNNPLELILFVALGAGLGLISSVGNYVFSWQQNLWHDTIKLPVPVKTMVTGAVVGLVAVFLPQIMGTGEEFMHGVISGHIQLAVPMLIILAVAKLFMTAISLGGGFYGGVFSPTLFAGITLGSAYGEIVQEFAINSATPQTFAIAGMAGMLSGVVRAPITAILLVFELTNDYQLILPIMLTSVVSVLLAELTKRPGIYKAALVKNGVYLQEGRDIDVMQGITVGEAMQSPAPVILDSASLSELRDALRRGYSRAICVIDKKGHFVGKVTLEDLQRTYADNFDNDDFDFEQLHVGDIRNPDPPTIHPDDPLYRAVRLMSANDVGYLPVLKENSGELVGLLRHRDIMDAYNMVISRKFRDQTTASKIRLNRLTGANVLEYHINMNSPIVGKRIREVKFPEGVVIASLRRGNRLIVPNGRTFLWAHDVVTVVADEDAVPELDVLFG